MMKILEWVHLLETKRVSTPVFQEAIERQRRELATAMLRFEAIEIEPEDHPLWLQDLQPALKGVLEALGHALTQAELYIKTPTSAQVKLVLSHLQEVERVEQYVQTRMACVSYLTQKQIEDLLRVASEKVDTLLSME